MQLIHSLVARAEDSNSLSPTMTGLLVALLVLALIAMVLLAGLLFLRRLRNSRKLQSELPMYNEKRSSRNTRRLTIATSRGDSIYVYQEKQNLIANSSSPPASPVPEIRITFPEEVDESGKKMAGKVVVVRVGEQSIGLEPLQDDLPPYQPQGHGRFHSLDLDSMGGLKEKDPEKEKMWS